MSYLPSIRPGLVQRRLLQPEGVLSRLEIARRHEERLYQQFRLITKQTDHGDGPETGLPDLAESDGSESNISNSGADREALGMPEMEMTDQDFDTNDELDTV